jgi:hypothetical protein
MASTSGDFAVFKNMTTRSPNRTESRGFALVVSLALMVLLTVLAVGLLGLSAVSLRSSSQQAAQSEARANARMALFLAMGQLQKAMGPDARISARAATLAKDSRLGASVGPNTAKAWWVGVAGSNRDKGLDSRNPVGSGNPAVVWLVSGLDPQAPPEAQISAAKPFNSAVLMLGDNSIDTAAMTGGEPIQAGNVTITGQSDGTSGGFAYFIDDNGMKAQLAANNPNLRNDRQPPNGGGVLPGTYDLSILDNMASLKGAAREDYLRLLSVNDLPLIADDKRIARSKRFGYTTLSRGVLSDVRKGGLKRDLTIAFERDSVFANVFPKGNSGFGEAYLVLDSKRLSQSPDLQTNGYIHWEMFKDHYNIKKHIKKSGAISYLDSILINKNGIFSGLETPFARGQLGPHNIGQATAPAPHQAMPYGDYQPIAAPSNTDEYKHSPVIPILSRMQQNAWMERRQPDKIRTNVQLWQAQYNPYNVGLNVVGDSPEFGPRFIHYPQIFFTVSGMTVKDAAGSTFPLNNISGHSGKRQSSVPHQVLLGPGRSHVYAFKDYGTVGRDDDEFLYDDSVRNLTLQSIYREFDLVSAPDSMTLKVDFVLERPSMIHGANSNSYNANHEVAQTLWAPFAWDAINGNLPGKTMTKSGISPGQLNENSMLSFGFNLRTTKEGAGAVRPLVDANIRAMFGNTKWDSPLGVDLLAAYSPRNRGAMDEQIPQMNVSDNPKGYTYWGAGLDAADGYDRVILFDIPRDDLLSLGQLQHAGVGRFSYEPTYIVGNSYANPRIGLTQWKTSVSDTFSTASRGLQEYQIPGQFNLYDASFLVNEELWDSYIFTTIPQAADNVSGSTPEPAPNAAHFTNLLQGTALLPNPRFIPYEPRGSKFDRTTLQMTTASRATTGGFYHNAGHLLVDGAFNVNSTSVDAWEAFLSGTHELPYQKLSADSTVTGFSPPGNVKGVRFPRVKAVFGKGTETTNLDENYWIGFRTLEQKEVRSLAEAIVSEIRKRGPFLTLGEFVNRKLEDGETGQRGALQAALDMTVNKDLDKGFEQSSGHPKVPKDSTQGAGFPGQLLQGDILQALSPCMTVRSDSFTIRAYGESRTTATNEVRATAWCEATVQRYPDPVASSAGAVNPLSDLVNPASRFGRSFRMLSFRWLNRNEI